MGKIQYSLVVSDNAVWRGLHRSSDPQFLRELGAKYARNPSHNGELTLVGPYGHALEQYDIWTSQWNCTV